jgi:hypothetical protein
VGLLGGLSEAAGGGEDVAPLTSVEPALGGLAVAPESAAGGVGGVVPVDELLPAPEVADGSLVVVVVVAVVPVGVAAVLPLLEAADPLPESVGVTTESV